MQGMMNMKIENKETGAQSRENAEPHEKNKPVPYIVLLLVFALLIWAIFYIYSSPQNDNPALGDARSMADFEQKAVISSATSIDGSQIYMAQCVACHQTTGLGLPGVFPPLAGSEWVLQKDTLPINILLHGINGKLTVKAATYSGAMPAFKEKLNDAEIAAVLTYVRSNFGNNASPSAADTVKKIREESKERTQPWNGDDELTKLKD